MTTTIPFLKAHGARNDFLLTWAHEVPAGIDLHQTAIAICDRHAGVGADGWQILDRETLALRLINSDGSDSEISGNGTRCAAAMAVAAGAAREHVTIRTGAGEKHLTLKQRQGNRFLFEMDMGMPELREETEIEGYPAVVMWVGNPQCALMVDEFPENWREIGRRVEWMERFPRRTNVSFVKRLDAERIAVRFWERGAGATQSSGTGSTGALFAAMQRAPMGAAVTVETEAGPLHFRREGTLLLTGPAELIARGEFLLSGA
jgi:diaminopimelate epimerase